MAKIIPYHEMHFDVYSSPLAEAHGAGQRLDETIVGRDWHLAHIEDRARSTHDEIPSGVGALALAPLELSNVTDRLAARYEERNLRGIEAQLAGLRGTFRTWGNVQRRDGDSLLRHYGLDESIVTACDQQMSAQGMNPNLIAWLGHAPDHKTPYGATNAQLARLVSWSAELATSVAGVEKVDQTLDSYRAGKRAAVEAGHLAEGWLAKEPAINRVVIGDLLDKKAIGDHEGNVRGRYYYAMRTIRLWPYHYKDTDAKTRQMTTTHEETHAMGGFSTNWLNEGFTQRYALRVAGSDSSAEENDVYETEQEIIQLIYDGASKTLGDKETSAAFIGPGPTRNQRQLRKIIAEAYDGLDVLPTLLGLQGKLKRHMKKVDSELGYDESLIELREAAAVISAANKLRAQGDIEGMRSLLQQNTPGDSKYEAGLYKLRMDAIRKLFGVRTNDRKVDLARAA